MKIRIKKPSFIERIINRWIDHQRKRDWMMDAIIESTCMHGFIRENSSCTDLNLAPSKKIIKRYNLPMSSNLLVWYLLEKYFNGELVEKQKGNG